MPAGSGATSTVQAFEPAIAAQLFVTEAARGELCQSERVVAAAHRKSP
ncbi:hypothetical protein [Prescottella equi]|nr:hypothetical protein [Prescottella equi]UNQ38087.1 hypothetical protein MPC38_15175 [Prescottella equi]